jgi:DNA-binding transcriptional ArsR family regulator
MSEPNRALEKLKSEIKRREDAVLEAEKALVARRMELQALKDEARAALGLDTPPAAKNSHWRARCAVVEKAIEVVGTDPKTLAKHLNMDVRVVEEDLRHLRRLGRLAAEVGSGTPAAAPESPTSVPAPISAASTGRTALLPGESVQDGVKRLSIAGKSPDEICELLDVSRASVGQHLGKLRRAGDLPPADATTETEADEQEESEPADAEDAEETTEEDADEEETDGDTEEPTSGSPIAELRSEVERQGRQSDNRIGPFMLASTVGGKNRHRHRAKVDRMGDGFTLPDDSGHSHRVTKFVVIEAHRHDHGLVCSDS